MDTQLYDQITNLLEKSQNILILTHARADCDGLGAALASYLVFKEMGKDVTVATNDPAQENLMFLPAIDILQNSIAGSADFIITIDTEQTPVGKIKYNVEDHKVNIIITPKSGNLSESDVSFMQGKAKFDLIFVLDTGNLEHLGGIYERNVEMFFETPVINMDHHSSNTDFGQVNVVNATAASTTEILYEYLAHLEKKMNKKLITEDVATLLLGGIITDTGSFQHANTSPRSMKTAGKLLDLGGRQQEIIKNIYKTKKLSTLKLWGIILSKVQVDTIYRLVWSNINKQELQEVGADSAETEGVIDDLLTNAPGAEVIFLIKQNDEYTSVSMRSTGSAIDVGAFCAEQGGGGHARAAGFKVKNGRPFDQVVNDVVERVRAFQAERLNIHPEDKPAADLDKKPASGPTVDQRQVQAKPANRQPVSREAKPANRQPVSREAKPANRQPVSREAMPKNRPVDQNKGQGGFEKRDQKPERNQRQERQEPENRETVKTEVGVAAGKPEKKGKTTYLDFKAPPAPEGDETTEEKSVETVITEPLVESVTAEKPAGSASEPVKTAQPPRPTPTDKPVNAPMSYGAAEEKPVKTETAEMPAKSVNIPAEKPLPSAARPDKIQNNQPAAQATGPSAEPVTEQATAGSAASGSANQPTKRRRPRRRRPRPKKEEEQGGGSEGLKTRDPESQQQKRPSGSEENAAPAPKPAPPVDPV